MSPTFDLLQLREGPRSGSFTMVARNELATPFGFLYGGSGIAACVEAAERATGRPLMWITTQFLSNAHPDQVVEVDVKVAVDGRATSQVQVAATVDGTPMLSSLCAHTSRPDHDGKHFVTMPVVAPPERCEPMVEPLAPPGDRPASFFDAMERRVPEGSMRFGDGPIDGPFHIWTRLIDEPIGSAATLAFVADILPLAVSLASGRDPGGTSLDNTLRMVRSDVTEWVLIEIIPEALHRSIGQGTIRIWNAAGALLAVAQQTCIIRTSHHSG